jgi:Family of unknown function (DUF6084)
VAGPVVSAIPRLTFAVRDVAPLAPAAVPTLRFALALEADCPIRSVLLDVQVRIAARRRAYEAGTHDRLFELFGPPAGWGTALRTLPWTRATLVVPPFDGAAEVALDVPCTYDLEVAATRYLDALGDGDVPLELLFSGSVFYAGEDGRLQTARIPWEAEAEHRLPVAVWRATLEAAFPGTAWLRLEKDAFDRLVAFKARNALPTWEAAVDALLEGR